MITKQTSFSTGDRLFHTIEEAQQHELEELLSELQLNSTGTSELLAQHLIKNKDKIVDCLTMKATSKARARKINGGTRKPRTAKPTDKPAEAKLI